MRKAETRNSTIAVIGVQPGPVHGLSTINARMAELLAQGNAQPAVIDLAVHLSCGRIPFALRRVSCACVGAVRLLRLMLKAENRVVYMGLSGGAGQVFDLIFIVLARLLRAKLVIHHHSFAYLDYPTALARLVFEVAGDRAIHVTLCSAMKTRLQLMYGNLLRVVTVSNAALLQVGKDAGSTRSELRIAGFLSNITAEKGIFEFLDVAQRMQHSELQFVVAGPFGSPELEKIVRRRLETLRNVRYAGPVYGNRKVEFLRATDVLLFPTRYQHEAEPLTVYEAMSFSAPVIARQRGCIESVLGQEAGKVVEGNASYPDAAVRQLQQWMAAPESFQQASRAARARYVSLMEEHRETAAQLVEFIAAPDSAWELALPMLAADEHMRPIGERQ